MYGAGDVRVIDVPDPVIEQPTDALVRVVRPASAAATCTRTTPCPRRRRGKSMGHEFVGVVEDVGARGDDGPRRATSSSRRSPGPTAPATSAARACRPPAGTAASGTRTASVRRPGRGRPGTAGRRHAGEGARCGEDSALVPSLLTLSDVYGTGYHAAVQGWCRRTARTVTVIGDGAVGLLAVLSAQAARRRADHPDGPPQGPHRPRPRVRRHRRRRRARRRRASPRSASSPAATAPTSSSRPSATCRRTSRRVGVVRAGRRDQPRRRPAVRRGTGRLRQPLRSATSP